MHYETKVMTLGELLAMEPAEPRYSMRRGSRARFNSEDYINGIKQGLFPGGFTLGIDAEAEHESSPLVLEGYDRIEAIREYERELHDKEKLANKIYITVNNYLRELADYSPITYRTPLLFALRSLLDFVEKPDEIASDMLSILVSNACSTMQIQIPTQMMQALNKVQPKVIGSLAKGSILDAESPVTICTGTKMEIAQTFVIGDLASPYADYIARCHWDSIYCTIPEGAIGDEVLSYVRMHYHYLQEKIDEQNQTAYTQKVVLSQSGEMKTMEESEPEPEDQTFFSDGELDDEESDTQFSFDVDRKITLYELACAIAGLVIEDAPILETNMYANPIRLQMQSFALGYEVLRVACNPEGGISDGEDDIEHVKNMVSLGGLDALVPSLHSICVDIQRIFTHFMIPLRGGDYAMLFSVDARDRFCPQAILALLFQRYEIFMGNSSFSIRERASKADKEDYASCLNHMPAAYLDFILSGRGIPLDQLTEQLHEGVDWAVVEKNLFSFGEYNKLSPSFRNQEKILLSMFTAASVTKDAMRKISESDDPFECAQVFDIPPKALNDTREKTGKNIGASFANWYVCPEQMQKRMNERRKNTSAWSAARTTYGSDDAWVLDLLESVSYPEEGSIDEKGTYRSISTDLSKDRTKQYLQFIDERESFILDNFVSRMRAREAEGWL